jgi:hypothetical protein
MTVGGEVGMEWWILLSVVGSVLVIGVMNRMRKARRREAKGEADNIYPLW